MRIVPFVLSTLATGLLVFALNSRIGPAPALGAFLSPQQGFWQNAEPEQQSHSADLKLPGLKGKTTVHIDERLVPHVFSDNEQDVYYVQGYLHAKYRLWQMEFQTLFGAGRISEVLGNDARFLRVDREQRRMGMVFAAENTLKAMESDPEQKAYFDAYTAGVNAYINNLSAAAMPLEYKLLGYKPEPWSNLKTAIFIKVMSKDLAGYERDLEFTNEKAVFSLADMQQLFPEINDSSVAIVPAGTPFAAPGVVPVKPAGADSLYFGNDTTLRVQELGKPVRENGSNNWAVAGSRTASGAPILCNDPHLTLSLPAIWFEMQLSTPTMNVYGATFPGAPSVIIGFNEHIAFGFTNSMRDVKDYYSIRFRDASKKEYWYNGRWEPTRLKVEEIRVARGSSFYDTVAYTVFGPVMYDAGFTKGTGGTAAIAVRWAAHEGSNEAGLFFRLDRARNYDEYLDAIRDLHTPGQNMLFASKTGDIALWQQGKFPARWPGQGSFVMPGEDSSYAWQGFIPQEENPHLLNPPEGFIESANQRPVDASYPYFIPGNYISSRGRTIHKALSSMQGVTPQQMMALQNNVYNSLAADAVPLILRNVDAAQLDAAGQKYLSELQQWNYHAEPGSRAMTIYAAVIDSLESVIWGDEFAQVAEPKVLPDEETLVALLLRDSASHFIDDIRTPEAETLASQLTKAFRMAAADLQKEESDNGLIWYKHKNTTIYHLLRESVPSLAHAGILVGGWRHTPNAVTQKHGPSWRMIVQLSTPTEAYGIYPGGQSGNPGSRFYDNFTNDWAAGKYYTLWLMRPDEARDKRVKWTLTFNPA
ncbi:MAG: penicillin acylase family protein [Chitinophagaceae bacterium]|nr:MAG: penicillin acylase family protein [Chitinophagaceae bacterium]